MAQELASLVEGMQPQDVAVGLAGAAAVDGSAGATTWMGPRWSFKPKTDFSGRRDVLLMPVSNELMDAKKTVEDEELAGFVLDRGDGQYDYYAYKSKAAEHLNALDEIPEKAEWKLAAWECFVSIDREERLSVSTAKLGAFLARYGKGVRVTKPEPESGEGGDDRASPFQFIIELVDVAPPPEEGAVRDTPADPVTPLLSGGPDDDDDDDCNSGSYDDHGGGILEEDLNFSQFVRLAERWKDTRQFDFVEDFRKGELRRRWGRWAWMCDCTLDRFRRSNIKARMRKTLNPAIKRQDMMGAGAAIFGEVMGFVDLGSDLRLLWVIYKELEICMTEVKWLCSQHHLDCLGIALTLSVLAPYLIAYSSFVKMLADSGFFERRRLRGCRALLGILFVTCMGPLYFVFIDACMLAQALTWGPISLILPDRWFLRGKGLWDGFFTKLGLDRMALEGYKRQRSIVQLLFETIPQVILQSLVVHGVLDGGDIMRSSAELVYFSIAMSCANLMKEYTKTWVEARGLLESFINYAMICTLGRPGWVPWLKELARVPDKTSKTFDISEIHCTIPCVSDLSGVTMVVHYEFSADSVDQFVDRMAFVTTEAAGETFCSRHQLRLGGSCVAITLQSTLELILACQHKIHVDFSGVNWGIAVQNSRNNQKLWSVDNGKWEASTRSGEPILKVCLLGEQGGRELNPPDDCRTASSAWDDDSPGVGNNKGMLDSDSAWVCAGSTSAAWYAMDFGEPKQLCGIVYQRRAYSDQYVTNFTVRIDDEPVDKGKVFDGFDKPPVGDERMRVYFDEPVCGRRMEISITGYNVQPALRVGALEALPGKIHRSHNLGHVANELLCLGASPNILDAQGEPLLLTCARMQNIEAVKLLLHYRADVNSGLPKGRSALCESIHAGNRRAVDALLLMPELDLNKACTAVASAGAYLAPATHALIAIGRLKSRDHTFVKALQVASRLLQHDPPAKLPTADMTEIVGCLCACVANPPINGSKAPFYGMSFATEHLFTIKPDGAKPGESGLLQWVTRDGDTLFHIIASGKYGYAPMGRGVWANVRMFLELFDTEEVKRYAMLKNTTGSTALDTLLDKCMDYVELDQGRDTQSDGDCLVTWLKQNAMPEDLTPLKDTCSDALYRLASADNNAMEQIKAYLELFGDLCDTGLAFRKVIQLRDLAICDLFAAAVGLTGDQEKQRVILSDEVGNKAKPGNELAREAGAPPGLEHAVTTVEAPADASEVHAARRAIAAAAQLKPQYSSAEERVLVLMHTMLCLLELVSSADFVTDVLIVWKMLTHYHIQWATLTVLMMVSPYLVAYAATMNLLLRNRVFEAEDRDGKPQKYMLLRYMAAVIYIGPPCIAYFLLIDVIYALRAILVDIWMILLGLLTCGCCQPSFGGDGLVNRFCSGVLGLTKMDIEGYRRMRTMSQLIFESFPQVLLQLRIWLNPVYAEEMGVTRGQLIASMGFAVSHSLVSLCVLWAEARTCNDSLIHYAIICLNGRFGWVPFLDMLSRRDIDSSVADTRSDTAVVELEADALASRRPEVYRFGDMGFSMCCGFYRFTMLFEFSKGTARRLVEVLSRREQEEDSKKRPTLELGSSVALLSLEDIMMMHRGLDGKANLVMSMPSRPVDWHALLYNSSLGIVRGPDGAPTLPTDQEKVRAAEAILEEFMHFQNYEVLHALLMAGCHLRGVTKEGQLFLTRAVTLGNPKLCELMLDCDVPIIITPEAKEHDEIHEAGGMARSVLVAPLMAALEARNPDIIDVFALHPRIRMTALQREEMLHQALDEFAVADVALAEEKASHMKAARRFVFLFGGLHASANPDMVANGSTVRKMAGATWNGLALKWLDDMERETTHSALLRFTEGDLKVPTTDLERFMVFRDKLTANGSRWPLGHPKNIEEDEAVARLASMEGLELTVSLESIQAELPSGLLTRDTFAHLLAVAKEPGEEGKLAPLPALIPTMDRLVASLGLDKGLGCYIRATASLRLPGSVSEAQEGPLHIDHREEGRAKRILGPIVLPIDCWRVTKITAKGDWTDQGWGTTNCNWISLMVDTKFAGRIDLRAHQIDNHDDLTCSFEWSLEGGATGKQQDERVARSALEALTGGDEISLMISCIPWTGHQAKASNSSMTIEYVKRRMRI